jgi:hypothetical protein
MFSIETIADKDSTQYQLLEKRTKLSICALVLIIAVVLAAHLGKLLILPFPVFCTALGYFLSKKLPPFYIGYTLWLWFLAPAIRRIIDYQSGYFTPGPWHLVPLLVTSISLVTFLQCLPKLNHKELVVFALPISGIFYSFLIGLVNGLPIGKVLMELLSVVGSISFGFYIYSHWQDYPDIRVSLDKTLLWGLICISGYGIFQFLAPPEWESFLLHSEFGNPTFGKPFPYEIRVFSTMNSPQACACVLSTALLVLIASKPSPIKLPALVFGSLTLLLTQARTFWLGFLVGLLALIPFLKMRAQLRLLTISVSVGFFVVLVATDESFYDVISKRLESLSNTSDDVSLGDRKSAFFKFLGFALTRVIGYGLAGADVLSVDNFSAGDSGLLYLLVSLGLLGSIPYFIGLSSGIVTTYQLRIHKNDDFISSTKAIITSFFFFFFFIAINEFFGVAVWGFVGVGLAASRYYYTQSEKKLYQIKNNKYLI